MGGLLLRIRTASVLQARIPLNKTARTSGCVARTSGFAGLRLPSRENAFALRLPTPHPSLKPHQTLPKASCGVGGDVVHGLINCLTQRGSKLKRWSPSGREAGGGRGSILSGAKQTGCFQQVVGLTLSLGAGEEVTFLLLLRRGGRSGGNVKSGGGGGGEQSQNFASPTSRRSSAKAIN